MAVVGGAEAEKGPVQWTDDDGRTARVAVAQGGREGWEAMVYRPTDACGLVGAMVFPG
eukprot:SAG22_NODE_8840_length_626_cov_1.616698_1_plen_58_part_00